jgi:hypothetical protein
LTQDEIKLISIAEKLDLKIERNSKKIDLVNRISDNVNNANLNTLLKEVSKTKSTQNKFGRSPHEPSESIKELRKIAKEKNIKGYSKMKKAELLQKIGKQPFAFEDDYFTEL